MSDLKLCEFSLSTMGFDLEIKAQFFIDPAGPKVKSFEMNALDQATGKPVSDKTTLSFLHNYIGPRMQSLINEKYQG
jgi:hypothetical protein